MRRPRIRSPSRRSPSSRRSPRIRSPSRRRRSRRSLRRRRVVGARGGVRRVVEPDSVPVEDRAGVRRAGRDAKPWTLQLQLHGRVRGLQDGALEHVNLEHISKVHAGMQRAPCSYPHKGKNSEKFPPIKIMQACNAAIRSRKKSRKNSNQERDRTLDFMTLDSPH